MTARFHAPDAYSPGDVVSLPDEESEHLTRVLRLKRGDPIAEKLAEVLFRPPQRR